MGLATIDWAIIAGYLALSFGIAAYYTRRASSSTGEFFLSGRKLPWYLAGTTMVATTFAADTPLAITELVASRGIAGNWLWWNMLLGGMLASGLIPEFCNDPSHKIFVRFVILYPASESERRSESVRSQIEPIAVLFQLCQAFIPCSQARASRRCSCRWSRCGGR